MKTEKFDNAKFKKSLGLTDKSGRYEKYDYEKYKAINPKLTEDLYRRLYSNHALFMIVCGYKITSSWGNVVDLEPVWHLDTPFNNQRRYRHGYDGFEW